MTRYFLIVIAISCTFLLPAASHSQNVGIGTTTPVAKLDIIGSLKITNGTQGANKVLTSDTAGLAIWATLPATPPSCFFFATDGNINTNSYLGMGTTSASFIRNTIVVPVNCELSSIVFNTRSLIGVYTATVWRQSLNFPAVATTLSTTVSPGSYFNLTNGSVLLFQGDLISVQISGGSNLPNGAAVSVTYK